MIRLLLRMAVLAVILGVLAVGLPNSAAPRDDVLLMKTQTASGVDAGSDVIWILGIGSDARPWEPMLETRGDALQLVGINTKTGAATAIGIPRDSWVAIPEHGSEKINSALYFGGPKLQAQTVGNLIGIQPDYVFVTRFESFENLVYAINGIEVNNPRAFSDEYLKDDGFKAGRIKLSGYDALAFSRIRKSLPGGDFDRSANQQRVMRGIHRKIVQRADEPGFLEQGALNVMRYTSTDLPPAQLFRLATAVANVDARKITTCVIPGGIGYVGEQSVVFPDVATARGYGNDARRDATLDKGC